MTRQELIAKITAETIKIHNGKDVSDYTDTLASMNVQQLEDELIFVTHYMVDEDHKDDQDL